MPYKYEDYRKSADFIYSRTGFSPQTALILGSGLGAVANSMEDPVIISYEEIPYFKPATTLSHEGSLYCGNLFGVKTLIMKGRLHYYEGYTPQDIAFPINVFSLLGVKNLIILNAAGGLKDGMKPGDIMLITDHLSFFSQSPLRGENIGFFGPRFPDMSSVYSKSLADLADKTALNTGIRLFDGVYAYMPGPQYETPAEIRALKALGADAVGMSTVYEAIAAAHCGIPVLALSTITNLGAGMGSTPLDGADVVSAADNSLESIICLLEGIFKGIKNK